MRGAKDVRRCRDQSLGPSVTGCLTFGLEKIALHHRQSAMVSVGRSTGEETSLSPAIADPQRQQRRAEHHLHRTCWLLGSVVPCLETQVAPSPGSFQALGGHLGPHMGLEGKREWSSKGAIKISFMGTVGGRIFPAAPRDTEIAPRDALGGLKMKRKRLKRNSQGN